jgi:hypothetical protein
LTPCCDQSVSFHFLDVAPIELASFENPFCPPAASALSEGADISELVPDIEGLGASMRRLQSLLDTALGYVDFAVVCTILSNAIN